MLFNDPAWVNPFSILDRLVYLEQDEAILTSEMVPLVENLRLNSILVDYRYVMAFPIHEGYTVVVDEEDVVVNPSIFKEFQSMVVRPLSELDEEFVFVQDACEAWIKGQPFDPNGYTIQEVGTVPETSDERRKRHRNFFDISRQFFGGGRVVMRSPSNPGKVKNQQSITDAMADLARVFGSKFNPNFVNKERLQKALDRNGHLANMNDQFLCDLVGLPFGSVKPKKPVPPPKQPPTLQRYLTRAKDAMWDNKGKISVGLAATATAAGLYKYVSHKLEQKPKSVIGKRVVALRHIYQSWMEKAQRSSDPSIAAKLKKAAATILQVIDMVLAKLQNTAERTYRP